MELYNAYSGDELQLKLAERTADEWISLYKPKVFKKHAPERAVEYNMIKTEKQRDKFHDKYPDFEEEMVKYQNEAKTVEYENEANRCYLKDTIKVLEKSGDDFRCQKVKQIYNLYKIVAT